MASLLTVKVEACNLNSAQYHVRCSTIRIVEDSPAKKEQGFSADKT
jgi:hypothetical protein